jgi:hypothetical protein
MARYDIFVKENGSNHEVLLMSVGSNPNAIVQGLYKKKLTIRHSIFEKGRRTSKISKYDYVRIVDHGEGRD